MTIEAAGEGPRARSDNDQAWARWVARSVDAFVLLAISYGVWYVIGTYWHTAIEFGWLTMNSLNWALSPTLQLRLADAVTFILLVLVIEPFFIGLAGATPGKWLMGIRITRSDGRNLGYGGAFARTFMVITLGLALYIPVASFVAMLLQFLRVSNGNRAAWDDILDSRVVHVQRPVLLWLVLIALIVGVRVALRWEEIQARFNQ